MDLQILSDVNQKLSDCYCMDSLIDIKNQYIGRNGLIKKLFDEIKTITDVSERKETGKNLNYLKSEIEKSIEKRMKYLKSEIYQYELLNWIEYSTEKEI